MMKHELLAWSQYPEPSGTSYHEADLVQMDRAVELLDRAQIFRAHITAAGWRWLWSHYGVQGLLALNQRGLWFDAHREDVAIDQIVRRSVIAGYDPIADGSYQPMSRSRAHKGRAGAPLWKTGASVDLIGNAG